jgi:hypothetical protein
MFLRRAFLSVFGIGSGTLARHLSAFRRGEDNFSREVSTKDRRLKWAACHAWLDSAVKTLAEQMPHQARRTTEWSKRVKSVQNLTVSDAEGTRRREESESDASRQHQEWGAWMRMAGPKVCHAVRETLKAEECGMTFQSRLKKEFESKEPDSVKFNSGDAKKSGMVEMLSEQAMGTVYRFSCTHRNALHGMMMDHVFDKDNPIESWPRGRDGQFARVSCSYFYKVLASFTNVSFYKDSTFTKCDVCAVLRNSLREKQLDSGSRKNLVDARAKHLRMVTTEVTS